MTQLTQAGLARTDAAAVAAQLGRAPRGAFSVAHRCRCGLPDVIRTAPRLADGTPFPTTYYLTCPRTNSRIGTLEASGLMTELTAALENDPELARRYQAAHEAYVDDRDALAAELHLDVPELAEVSAGGMPDRVKCLHALVAHSLVAGPGVNPIGDQVIAALPDIAHWDTPCVDPEGDG